MRIRLKDPVVQRVRGEPVSFRANITLDGRDPVAHELIPVEVHEDGSVTYRCRPLAVADARYAFSQHPADGLKVTASSVGLEIDPEAETHLRAICDEPVGLNGRAVAHVALRAERTKT